jgi:hypothetical protein
MGLLDGTADTKEADPEGRLHLLRALANGQKYKEARQSGKPGQDRELEAIRRQIRKDLAFAFEQNPTLRSANKHFWQPTALSTVSEGDREDDLRAVFQDDPEFRKLVSPAPDGNTNAEPSAGGDRQP